MIIPKQLKVGGHIYKVLQNYHFAERTDKWGQTDSGVHEVRIADGDGAKFSKSRIEQTFIHELLHTVDLVYHNGKLEEEDVAVLSEGLYQVLKDNGLLK